MRHSKPPFCLLVSPLGLESVKGRPVVAVSYGFAFGFFHFAKRRPPCWATCVQFGPSWTSLRASVGFWPVRALRPSRFAALRLAAGAPRAWLLEVELHSLVASFSKCNVIVRLQFDVRIIPNNVTSCESTRLRAATKTAWSAALGSTFCEWADAGYGCCFVIGDPCRFDWLRNHSIYTLCTVAVGDLCHFDRFRNFRNIAVLRKVVGEPCHFDRFRNRFLYDDDSEKVGDLCHFDRLRNCRQLERSSR